MNSNIPEQSSTEEEPEQVLLSWRSIPAKRDNRVTALVSLVVIGLPVVLGIWYGPFYGLLGLAILGGSLSSFFLPTDFALTDRTIARRYLGVEHKRDWSDFRSFYPDKNGVLLSPFLQPSRLENFRGMYLRFEGNRERVLSIVQDHITGQPAEETA
jgi:hypothetical protein